MPILVEKLTTSSSYLRRKYNWRILYLINILWKKVKISITLHTLWYRNERTLWGCKLERQRFGVGQNLTQHNKSVNRSADKETKSSVLDGCFHTLVSNNSIIKCKQTKLGRKSIKTYRSPPRHCDEMGVINEFITQSFRPLFVSMFIPGYKTAKLELMINFTPLQIIFRLGWTNFFF